MVAKYVRVLENREVYDKTGNIWTINDVPKTWRSNVEKKIRYERKRLFIVSRNLINFGLLLT